MQTLSDAYAACVDGSVWNMWMDWETESSAGKSSGWSQSAIAQDAARGLGRTLEFSTVPGIVAGWSCFLSSQFAYLHPPSLFSLMCRMLAPPKANSVLSPPTGEMQRIKFVKAQ